MTSQIKPQTLIDQFLRFAAPTLFGMPERMANGLMIVICAAIAFLVMGKLVITTQAYSSIMNAVGILYLSAAAFLIMGSLQYRKQYQNLMTDHVRADIFDGEHLVHQMAGIDIATIDLGILKSRYFWKLGLTTVSEQLVHAVYRARNLFGLLIFWLPAIMLLSGMATLKEFLQVDIAQQFLVIILACSITYAFAASLSQSVFSQQRALAIRAEKIFAWFGEELPDQANIRIVFTPVAPENTSEQAEIPSNKSQAI